LEGSGLSGQGGARLLSQLGERSGLVDGKSGQNSTIDRDTGPIEPIDETAVRNVVEPSRRLDANDPQATELALLLSTISVRVQQRAVDLQLGDPVAVVFGKKISFGVAEDLFPA
jgi:hypothetical protein